MAGLPTASSIERALACPSSVALPKVYETSERAERGHVLHRYVQDVIEVGRDAALAKLIPEERAIVADWNLAWIPPGARSEVSIAWSSDRDRSRELGQNLGRNYPETDFDEYMGTADVVALVDGWVILPDLKTGFAGHVAAAERNAQLRFLALAFCRLWGVEQARVAVVKVERQGPIEWAELDAMELDAIAAELKVLAKRISQRRAQLKAGKTLDVSMGDHCHWCPAADQCPGKTAVLRQLLTDRPAVAGKLEALTESDLGAAVSELRMIDGVTRAAWRRIHAVLRDRGSQPVPLPNGKVFAEVTIRNTKINCAVALQALNEEVDVNAAMRVAQGVTVTKKALREVLTPVAEVRGVSRVSVERELLSSITKRGGIGAGTPKKQWRELAVGEARELEDEDA